MGGWLAWPLHTSPIYWDFFVAEFLARRAIFELNENILTSKRAQAGDSKYRREVGSRRFEEMESRGGVISPFVSQSWEGHLSSPCYRSPPGQVSPFWPRACFLMGVASQLFCFTPELLQVRPVEQ